MEISEKVIERILHAIIAAAILGTQYRGIDQSGQIRQDVQEARCGATCIDQIVERHCGK